MREGKGSPYICVKKKGGILAFTPRRGGKRFITEKGKGDLGDAQKKGTAGPDRSEKNRRKKIRPHIRGKKWRGGS